MGNRRFLDESSRRLVFGYLRLPYPNCTLSLLHPRSPWPAILCRSSAARTHIAESSGRPVQTHSNDGGSVANVETPYVVKQVLVERKDIQIDLRRIVRKLNSIVQCFSLPRQKWNVSPENPYQPSEQGSTRAPSRNAEILRFVRLETAIFRSRHLSAPDQSHRRRAVRVGRSTLCDS